LAHLQAILKKERKKEKRKIDERGVGIACGINNAPTTNLSMGGRYCSMSTVESGKALLSEQRMANIATPR